MIVKLNYLCHLNKNHCLIRYRTPITIVKLNVKRLPQPPKKITYEIIQPEEFLYLDKTLEKFQPYKNIYSEEIFSLKIKPKKVILKWTQDRKQIIFLYHCETSSDDYKPNIIFKTHNNLASTYVLLDTDGLYQYYLYFINLPNHSSIQSFSSSGSSNNSSSHSSFSSYCSSSSYFDSDYFNSPTKSQNYVEFDDCITKQAQELSKQKPKIEKVVINDQLIENTFELLDTFGNGVVEFEDIERVLMNA